MPCPPRRSNRCSPRSPRRCRPRAISCSSRSGTAFAPSCFARARREIAIQSRDLRPLDRYFPELHAALAERLPRRLRSSTARSSSSAPTVSTSTPCSSGCTRRRRASPSWRWRRRRRSSPSTSSLRPAEPARRSEPGRASRGAREAAGRGARPPLYLTPVTRDGAVAAGWLREFEGAGLDGVIAKPLGRGLPAGQAGDAEDQAPAHRRLRRRRLSLAQEHDRRRARGDRLAPARPVRRCRRAASRRRHVSFTMARRRELAEELAPLRRNACADHPWRDCAAADPKTAPRRPSACPAPSAAGAPARTCPGCRFGRSGSARCKYDHLQGDRFRHATTFLRWRPDKPPRECRYDQLEVVPPYALKRIFGVAARSG